MGKLLKLIFGVVLLYIGGKIIYNNVKDGKEELFGLELFKNLKGIKDIKL